MKTVIILFLISIIVCYDRQKAKTYVDAFWDICNHQCARQYLTCAPWAYFGSEDCGYESHGGDSANFVSQSLIAAGHPILRGGYCRGYPCGKEEVDPTNLGLCLKQTFGWTRTCGYKLEPPSYMNIGDVVIYHTTSCDDFNSHAALITSVEAGVKITCHSRRKHNAPYNYILDSKPYIEWLHRS